MMPCNQYGSYLVLQRTPNHDIFLLCVRDRDRVRRYIIRQQDDGTFHIEGQVFTTIQHLIGHYQQQADGLCVTLRYPYILEKPETTHTPEKIELEISRHHIQFVKKLGVGRFHEVWEGLWNGTTSVAVKTLKPGAISADKFLQEADVLKKLRHPKIIQVYAVCTKEEPIFIVIELMNHGSLLEYLRGEGRSLKLPQLIDMVAQVADAMAYLEAHNYIHRILMARSILIGEKMICKVADFSLAVLVEDDIYEEDDDTYYEDDDDMTLYDVLKKKFPVKWTAPEAILSNKFSIKSDVWSFGIVLYEVITYGCFPYPGMMNEQVLEQLLQGYRTPHPPGCPDKLYDIMLDCWREEPANRPTFESLSWQLEEFFIHAV